MSVYLRTLEENLNAELDRLAAIGNGTWPRNINEALRFSLYDSGKDGTYLEYSGRIVQKEVAFLKGKISEIKEAT